MEQGTVENTNAAPEGAVTAAEGGKKKETEYTKVKTTDNRDVQFAGKRKVNREVLKDEAGKPAGVRFDFLNGETRTLMFSDINEDTKLDLLAHGVSQKVGDESAGVEKVDDMVLGTESMMDRLKKGEFYTTRTAGDSFAGASIVIKAICEVTGKDVAFVKDFLNKKLEAAKAAGQKLSRADLYASFRNPESKTGVIIERLEREERSKAVKVSANDLLAGIGEATTEAAAG